MGDVIGVLGITRSPDASRDQLSEADEWVGGAVRHPMRLLNSNQVLLYHYYDGAQGTSLRFFPGARQLVRQDRGQAAPIAARNRSICLDARTNWRAPTLVLEN